MVYKQHIEEIRGLAYINAPEFTKSSYPKDLQTPAMNETEDSRYVNAFREIYLTLAKNNQEHKDFPLKYHVHQHSQRVFTEFSEIIEIIRGIDANSTTREEIEVGTLCALGHDLVQKSDTSNGFRIRNRGTGIDQNEGSTAHEMYAILKRYYANVTEDFVQSMIYATHARTLRVEYKQDTYTVKQDLVNENTPIPALCLAWADLAASPGIREYEKYAVFCFQEFRELNHRIDPQTVFEHKRSHQPERALAEESEICFKILEWLRMTPDFIQTQYEDFEKSLETNVALNRSPKAQQIKEALREKFTHLKDNIELASAHYQLVVESLFDLNDNSSVSDKGKRKYDEYMAATDSGVKQDIIKNLLRAKSEIPASDMAGIGIKTSEEEIFANLLELAGYEVHT